MSKKRITMQMIADELGLSRWTVSSVINNAAYERGIAESTVKKINDYLKERGYVPSLQARELRLGNEKLIGLLFSGHLHYHLISAFEQFTSVFTDMGHRCEIMACPDSMALIEGVKGLLSRGVTKIIWLRNRMIEGKILTEELINYISGSHTIIYNCITDTQETTDKLLKAGVSFTAIDRKKSFELMGKRLIELGHKVVAVPDDKNSRYFGVSCPEGLKSAGLDVIPAIPVSFDFVGYPGKSREIACEAADNIIPAMKKHNITAVCLQNDWLAGFFLHELRERGIRVPEDLSVTGHNGEEITVAFDPPLSTLLVPVGDMVTRTLEMAIKNERSKTSYYCAELLERQSLGAARATSSKHTVVAH